MFLVDTSVWIDYLREVENKPLAMFRRILDQQLPFGITSAIYQEVLQGADSPQDFQRLKEFLSTQRFFYPRDRLESYSAAAQIYRRCREAGVTIRSTADCLIGQIALEHELHVVHNDRDFIHMARVISDLKVEPDEGWEP